MKVETIVADGFERIVRAEDASQGFLGFIAVHDTTLGPALGGLRLWDYACESDALKDVMVLAEAMTWKAAAARLHLGGGKAVICADARTQKTRERLLAMGEVIAMLGGSYITAEDVGIHASDLRVILERTNHVTGLPEADGGSGDPAPFTALGVLEAMKVCLEAVYGDGSLAGRTVAVQGLGNVGSQLVGLLTEAGASVVGADVHEPTAQTVAQRYGIRLADPREILTTECDVLAPCALGAVLDEDTIPRLRARVVAGAANNQLREKRDAVRLAERGILYAPDFVINAGGLINIAVEIEPEGYRRDEAVRCVKAIAGTLRGILDRARRHGTMPDEAALMDVRERIGRVRAGTVT